MKRYSLSLDAQRDIQEIWDYGAAQYGEDRADQRLDELHRRFALLAAQPLMGRSRE